MELIISVRGARRRLTLMVESQGTIKNIYLKEDFYHVIENTRFSTLRDLLKLEVVFVKLSIDLGV